MDAKFAGRACDVSDLSPGTCFVFWFSGKSYVGLRLADTHFVILGPPFPELPGVQSTMLPHGFIHEAVWAFDNAIIVAPQTPTAARLRSEYKKQIGALLISGKEAIVSLPVNLNIPATHPNTARYYVNLSSGAWTTDFPTPFVWFATWSIMVPAPDSTHWKLLDLQAVETI